MQRGMRFTQAYAANPLCSPTRASILTGLYPARLHLTVPNCHIPEVRLTASVAQKAQPWYRATDGGSINRLPTDRRTIATSFKEAGYRTGHFGKWHLGPEPFDPLHHGYDVDLPHYAGPGPAGSFVAPWKFPPRLAFTGQPGEHIEDRMAQEAVRFIDENKAKPFLLSYWAFSVHAPFDAKAELVERYRKTVDVANPQQCPVYAAMVHSLDDAVGTLVAALTERKLLDDTIIVFTSDNGGNMYNRVEGVTPTSNAPLKGGKATIYEGGSRVPTAVIWPGHIKAGAVNDALISSIDWAPTLHALTGVKTAPGQVFDGISIVPALEGGKLTREAIFCHFPHNVPATGNLASVWVRQGDWKLIRFFAGGEGGKDRCELYNLAQDQGETRDLSAVEPARVAAMDALIAKHLADTVALVPIANPAFDPAAKMPEPGKPAKKKPVAPPAGDRASLDGAGDSAVMASPGGPAAPPGEPS
jgi:arylsulfatase A-like enzyme